MDLEKQDKPLFKLDEERLEKFLKEMPEETKKRMRSLANSKDVSWAVVFLLMMFSIRDCPECDDKEE